jgi:hypothetical protein
MGFESPVLLGFGGAVEPLVQVGQEQKWLSLRRHTTIGPITFFHIVCELRNICEFNVGHYNKESWLHHPLNRSSVDYRVVQ